MLMNTEGLSPDVVSKVEAVGSVMKTFAAIHGWDDKRIHVIVLGRCFEPIITLYYAQYAFLVRETTGKKPKFGVTDNRLKAFVGNGMLCTITLDDLIVMGAMDEPDQGFDKLAQILLDDQLDDGLKAVGWDNIYDHATSVLTDELIEEIA